MLGSIIGDIIGSQYEFNNINTKDFELFTSNCRVTDDTVMTCAVAELFNKYTPEKITKKAITGMMQRIGQRYPNAGYGRRFYGWMFARNPEPYDSYGNGSAMRISPVAMVSESVEQCEDLADRISMVSHNHSEGIKGAECIACTELLVINGYSKQELKEFVISNYYQNIETMDYWKRFNNGQHGKEICQVTVPAALACFFESTDYEDCMRNCVSIGGDSDTLCAIAGSIAEMAYEIPDNIIKEAMKYIPNDLKKIIYNFYNNYWEAQDIGKYLV